MLRRPPRSTRTDTLFPYTTLFRSSLAFCDEIVVVDSGSVDGTRELCERLGARVLQRPFDGFRSQKRFAVEQCKHDWVLCLDADERVDERLREAIEAERAAGFTRAPGYPSARLYELYSRFRPPGPARPDRALRSLDRSGARPCGKGRVQK